MAGAFTVRIKIDDSEILDALTRLSRKADRLGPAFNNIGEALLLLLCIVPVEATTSCATRTGKKVSIPAHRPIKAVYIKNLVRLIKTGKGDES